MGWTSVKTNKTIEEIIENEFKYEKNFEVIYKYKSKNALYLAILNKVTNKIGARIIIYEKNLNTGEVFFKEMTENEGPYYYDAPKKLIKLLSPTDNEYAREWREKCLA